MCVFGTGTGVGGVGLGEGIACELVSLIAGVIRPKPQSPYFRGFLDCFPQKGILKCPSLGRGGVGYVLATVAERT